MWATVRDDFVIQPEAKEDFVEKECGDSFSSDCFLSGVENDPLRKAMVDHDQQRVKARRKRKVGDQITGDLLEGVRCVGHDQGERRDSGVGVCLVLLACGTAFDIFAHKLCKARPPKLHGDELASLEISGVTGGFVIMTAGEDGVTKGVGRRNVDVALVHEDVVIVLPVRETRPEGSRNILQGRLQMLEDEGVQLR